MLALKTKETYAKLINRSHQPRAPTSPVLDKKNEAKLFICITRVARESIEEEHNKTYCTLHSRIRKIPKGIMRLNIATVR